MSETLNDILKDRFGVTDAQLQEARTAVKDGTFFGDFFIERKILTEEQLLETYSRLYGMPYTANLPLDRVSTAFTDRIPIQFLRKYRMVPLRQDSPILETESSEAPAPAEAETDDQSVRWYIAVNDPFQVHAIDDLLRLMGTDAHDIVLATRSAILGAINISYDFSRGSAEQLVQDMEENGAAVFSDIEATADLLDDAGDAPIIKLVNHILSESINARASDVHIEPHQHGFIVRYRIDGVLYDLLSPPKWIQPSLISRIKVMAKLNIAEKRLPQDGRFEVRIGHQEIDVRVSTLPTTFGERVVMRLLNKSGKLLRMGELGLNPRRLDQVRELVTSPNGIILVTGPTGSGKTTSLYAILTSINSPEINIITIEDPVEYQLKGISQIQVNPRIELTFARGLRSIVRQDPDVILVGEIRDHETAEIAVQSALTGHLVFSTLHTNDSASAITRLVDIGIEPFLISSSVIAVIAQRLVRVLCTECRTPMAPEPALMDALGLTAQDVAGKSFFSASGCNQCFQSGFKGRLGIFEIMVMGTALKTLVLKTFDANRIKVAAITAGMTTLRQDGIDKVLTGITTMEEVLRVTHS